MDTIKDKTIERFRKSVIALEKALKLKKLPELANRDAVILRFELSAELVSKTLKRILSERGASPALPKDIVRSALSAEIFKEKTALTLLQIIDDRNRVVHDYSERYAEALFNKIKTKYAPALRELLDNISNF